MTKLAPKLAFSFSRRVFLDVEGTWSFASVVYIMRVSSRKLAITDKLKV